MRSAGAWSSCGNTAAFSQPRNRSAAFVSPPLVAGAAAARARSALSAETRHAVNAARSLPRCDALEGGLSPYDERDGDGDDDDGDDDDAPPSSADGTTVAALSTRSSDCSPIDGPSSECSTVPRAEARACSASHDDGTGLDKASRIARFRAL